MSLNREESGAPGATARNTAPPRSLTGHSFRTLRGALIGTVALSALLAVGPQATTAAPDACTPSVGGTVITCTGDQSAGITNQGATPDFTSPPVAILNVNGLTGDIAPANGVNGITFDTQELNATIKSDSGIHSIVTTGDASFGIRARINGFSSAEATVAHSGDIRSEGGGIIVIGPSNLNITHTGDITAGLKSGVLASVTDGSVTIIQTGDVSTLGDVAHGLYAGGHYSQQSTISHTGDVTTHGASSNGLRAMGGVYGGGASITQTGDVTTLGRSSHGVSVRTYYGDGSIAHVMGKIETTGDGALGILATGGGVEVTQSGSIVTRGVGSQGITTYSAYGHNKITQSGDISTHGDQSPAIRAIHPGRGGGGSDIFIMRDGNIETRGVDASGIEVSKARNIHTTITNTGDISTSGQNSSGIAVNIDQGRIIRRDDDEFAGDRTRELVTITQTGNIAVTGMDADAIKIINVENFGNADVKIEPGSAISSASGRGVRFGGGIYHGLTNHGTITSASGLAISGEGTGSEVIHNYGTIIGGVDLGSGSNVFNNMAGGIFNPGSTAHVGSGNTLSNAGRMSPGGDNAIQTTALSGNFVQTKTGELVVNLDPDAAVKSDRIDVTGTASVDGTIRPIFKGMELKEGASFTILTADGGVTNNGVVLTDVPAAAEGLQLRFLGSNRVVLSFGSFDFLAAGDDLSLNQTAIGEHLNAIFEGGVPEDLSAVFDSLLSITDPEELANALKELGAESLLSSFVSTYQNGNAFAQSMMSCPTANDVGLLVGAEGECLWARVSGRHFDQDRSRRTLDVDETSVGFTGGIQIALNSDWHGGFAFGYERAHGSIDTRATTETDRFNAGLSLKTQWHGMTLAAVLSGGFSETDTQRSVRLPNLMLAPKSSQDNYYGGSHVQIARTFLLENWYIRPTLDAGATYMRFGGINGQAGNAAGLTVSGTSEWLFSIAPSIKFGGQFTTESGATIAPYAQLGATILSDDTISTVASLTGAPAGVGSFAVTTKYDDVFASVDLGADIISTGGSSVRLNYSGLMGENTAVHSGGLKVRFTF